MVEKVPTPEEAYNAIIAKRKSVLPDSSGAMSPEEAYADILNKRTNTLKAKQNDNLPQTKNEHKASVFDKFEGSNLQQDPNLPEWSMKKAFSGGISDVFSRITSVLGMNTEQIKSTMSKKDLAEIAADPYLTQTEKAAVLRSKSINDTKLIDSLMAQRKDTKAAASSAEKYFDPGAYNMPKTVTGQLVHDTVRALPYTLGSMAYNIPIGIATGGGSMVASLLAASPEAQMEQADVYDEARKQGKSHDEAYALSQKVLAGNMALLPMSNYLQSMAATGVSGALRAANEGKPLNTIMGRAVNKGIRNETVNKFLNSDLTRDLASTGLDILAEGGEEIAQGYMADKALDKPVDVKALAYEGAVGGLMGALFGAGGIAADRAVNGRVNVKGGKAPGMSTDEFMENINRGIEEGTLSDMSDTEQVRKFVPDSRILSEMRNFYKEIRNIPEEQRSAGDRESFDALRNILEMYSSGHEEEAESLAKEYFNTDELIGKETEPAPMAMKDLYPPNVQIMPRVENSALQAVPVESPGPDAVKKIINLALGDIRRLNGIDQAEMSAADKYKYEMLNYAADAINKGNMASAANIATQLYGPAVFGDGNQENAPIEGRQFVNSELAVPGVYGNKTFSGETAYEGVPQVTPTGGIVHKLDGRRVFVPGNELSGYYRYPEIKTGSQAKSETHGLSVGDAYLAPDGSWLWISGIRGGNVTLSDADGKTMKISASSLKKSNLQRYASDTAEDLVSGMIKKGSENIEMPKQIRRKAEIVTDLAKMTKTELKTKYGKEAVSAAAQGGVDAVADVIAAKEAGKAKENDIQTAQMPIKESNRHNINGDIIPSAGVTANNPERMNQPYSAAKEENIVAENINENPIEEKLKTAEKESYPVGFEWKENSTDKKGNITDIKKFRVAEIRERKTPAVTVTKAQLTPTKNGIIATPEEETVYPESTEKVYRVESENADGSKSKKWMNPYEIGHAIKNAGINSSNLNKTENIKTKENIDTYNIIRQDNKTNRLDKEGISTNDDRGNDTANAEPLEDELSKRIGTAGQGRSVEAGDGVRKADALGNGHDKDDQSVDDGGRGMDGIKEPVLHDASTGTGDGRGRRTAGLRKEQEDMGGGAENAVGAEGKARSPEKDSTGDVQQKEEKPVSLLNPKEGGKPSELSGENPGNFFIDDDFKLGEGTAREKIAANLNALRTLIKLRKEKRYPTHEEQAVMAHYVGWGGLKQVFDVKNADSNNMYGKAQRVLKNMLSQEEYAAAFRTVSDAHYTSRNIVNAMWRAVRHFGFKGGRALEPTVGIGNFLGLEPRDLASTTEWHASEIDTVTGDIAAFLYPEANVLSSTGFQNAPFAADAFDLVIGNPPFGSFTITDKHKNSKHLSGMKIHNYVIAKSGMHLRPGGVMAFVVTHRFLDTANHEARNVLANDFHFLGAFRLPNDAFAKNAGTEIVTDVIFLQKLRADEKADQNAAWLDTNGQINVDGQKIQVNRYYGENPGHILGRSALDGAMYGAGRNNEYTVHNDGRDINKAIDDLLSGDFANLAGVLDASASDSDTKAAMLVQSDIPIGSMALDDKNRIIRRGMDDSEGNSVMEEITPDTLWKDNAAEWGAIVDALNDVKKAARTGKGLEESHAMLDSVAYITRAANGVKRGKPTIAEKSVYDIQDALESEGSAFTWKYDRQMDNINTSYRKKQLGNENFNRLHGMLELRQKLHELNIAERANDHSMEKIRRELNGLYDSFVAKYGPVSDKRNFNLLGGDIGVESGLEADYLEGVSPAQAKLKGIKPRKASATKSDIFSKRVFYPTEEIKKAGNSYDAMEISLSQRGGVDVAYMSELTGKPVQKIIEDLTTGDNPQLFLNPDTDSYEHAGEYLSGNVRRKLEIARNAGLDSNIKALESVQPQPKEKRNITPNIRGGWIPSSVFEDFLSAIGCERPAVSIIPGIGHIKADAARFSATDFGMQFTNEHKSVIDIFNAAAAGKSLTVKDKKEHVLEEATQKVNALADRMGKVFSEWAYTDEDRTKRIVTAYNEKMNTNIDRKYNGVKYLKTVGVNPSITLRNTQKNAAWRMIQSPSVLLDHVVGAGKTFTVITGIMERRRLGLSKKPLIVVPNHLVTQWAQDFYRLYPGAKILAATPADFTAKNRKRLFARIATTKDVDAIIIGHSSLGYIPSPDADLKDIIAEQITILETALDEARSNGESKRSLAQISQKLESYKEKLKDIAERPTDKMGHDLETLGIDYISVDEAHEFKNLEYATAGDRVVGMNDPQGSKKAFDLYVKIRGLRGRGGGVTFATGTPLSNSLVELYTMMKYLAADDLKERNMLFFDSWAGSYAVTETRLEYTPTQKLTLRRVLAGLNNLSSLRQLYTGFADIITMQDLKNMYKTEMEERNRRNHTKLRTEFPVPKITDGGRRLDSAPATDVQGQMTDWLVARMDAIQKHAGDKDYRRIDNYLTVMTDARKMSLDPRIIDPYLPRDENGKVMRSAGNIKSIYDKWSDRRGTQLVFCDMSTPSKSGQKTARKTIDEAAKMVFSDEQMRQFRAMSKYIGFARQWGLVLEGKEELLDSQELNQVQRDNVEEYFNKLEDIDAMMGVADTGFSVYDDLKTVLVEKGIPEREIAFIHDYESPEKKQSLFDSVNNGDIRVLMGSSAKMGAGMNVQRRLVGLHHLDSPWRSSDVEQREGRIVRQGNMFYEEDPDRFSVDIISYSTTGTADTVMWQILTRKAAAIEQFRNGGDIDSMEESSSDADQYAEFMATSTGDPVFRRKMEAERRYQELDADVSGALMAKQNARDFLKTYDNRVNENKKNLRILGNVELDEPGAKRYSDALKNAEEKYIDDYAAFEKDNAAARKALAEWENEPDKKKRGKKPESPVRPKRPSILSPGVQKASEFARAAKKAIEPLTESSAASSTEIPYGNGNVLVERINEQYTTPSWKVSFVPGKGNSDSYSVVIGQAEGKVPINLSQMTEMLLSPSFIRNKIISAKENLEQIGRRMETQKKNSEEIVARNIPLDKRNEAKTAMDWYAMQVAFAEVRADIARSEKPNPFIQNDRKHSVQAAIAKLEPPEKINVDGEEYKTTGVMADNPSGAGTLLEAVHVTDNSPVILIKRIAGGHDGQKNSYSYDVVYKPESVVTEEVKKDGGHYSLGKLAQENLDADAVQFAKQVDAYTAGRMPRHKLLNVMQTPLVLQISDDRVKPLPVVMTQNTLKKIFTKHNLSPNLVKRLPASLSDPIMVLRSDTHPNDSIVVMLEIKDGKGRTVNVPVLLNKTVDSDGARYVCNEASSAYGRSDINTGKAHNEWFVKQAQKEGQLLYVNTEKASAWGHETGLEMPVRELIQKLNNSLAPDGSYVNTEADLVYARRAGKGAYTIGKSSSNVLPSISVADVAARVKGADVSDLGSGKMKIAFPNGKAWLVDTQASGIQTDPKIVQRDYGRDVQSDDIVKGRTRIVDGRTFIDLVAGMSDAKTFSHEVFESAWDLLTKDEQDAVLNTYKNRENAAERYAEFLEGRVKKLTPRIQRIFQRIKDFFADIRASMFGKNSEDVFRDVASGKVFLRGNSAAEDVEHYRLERRKPYEASAPSRSSDNLEVEVRPDTSVVIEKNAPWLRDVGTTQLERVVRPSRQDESIKDKFTHVKNNFYRQWLDRLNPIKKHFGEDIFFDAENAIYGAASRAERRFEKGDPAHGVKGLLQIMEPVAADEQEGFATYVVYKHLNDIASNSERMIRTAEILETTARSKMREIGEDRKLPSPDKEALVEWKKRIAAMKAEHDLYLEQAHALREAVKFTRGNSAQYAAAVRKIEDHYPHWKKPQHELVRYNQALLELLKNSGMISEEMHERLLKLYPNYVPLQRDFGADENSIGGFISGMGLVNIQSPLRRLKGSKRDVIDPLEQIVRNTFQFESAAARQSVGRNIMEEYDKGNFHGLIEEVEDRHHDPDEMVWHVWENGKKRLFRSERDIYEALVPRARSRWEDNPIVAASHFVTQLLRKGTTHGLTFALRNPVRDTFNYAIVGDNFRPVIDTVRGLMMSFDKSVGSVYDDFMKSGGAQGMTVLTKNEHEERMKQLRHENGTVLLSWASLKNPPKAIYDLIGLISEYGELSSRLGQFERAKTAGYTSDEAANITRDNMNFMRMGTLSEHANQHIAFFNAALQGTDKMIRTYYKDGKFNKKAIIRSLMYITVPSLLQMMYNFDDEDRRKRYENLPAWRKNTFWNFVVGKDGPIVSIPKPFEIGMLFGSLPERVMEYAYTKKRRVFDGVGMSLVSSLTPEFYPNALMLMAEIGSNHSFFYQRQIVPDREKRFDPALQYGPYTAEWAKTMGGLLNISPRLLEYSIFSLGGGLAKETSNVSDALIRKYLTKETRPERPWYEVAPGSRGFFAGDGDATESAFQSEVEILNRKRATAEEILKTKGYNALSEAQKKLLRAANDIKAVSRLNSSKGGIYDAYRAIREITTAKGMNGVDKRARIKGIEDSILNASERGLNKIDRINEYLDTQ